MHEPLALAVGRAASSLQPTRAEAAGHPEPH